MVPLSGNSLIMALLNGINEHYWNPLHNYLKDNSHYKQTFPAFLLEQEQIVFYIGRTHLAIEYFGKETTINLNRGNKIKVMHYDYSNSDDNLFEKVIGFKYDSTLGDMTLPLPRYSDDMVWPTNRGMDKLMNLKWNWMAQNSIIGINPIGFHIPKGEFCRIVNGRFFDADEKGLKTRHIKWIDFLPLNITDETDNSELFNISLDELKSLVEHDAKFKYPMPHKDDYKYNKLPQINRFLELIGSSESHETLLTSFLEQPENTFILTMGFLSTRVLSQVNCVWQSQERNSIKPDFFVVRPNGYADIVEFKLPTTKSKSTVGKTNRATFSAEINSYISQTRVYKEYFEDPNNREWVEQKYDLKVRYPKRILVIGRRWDFSDDVWKEIIDDYNDIEIWTYDNLTDGVVSQFYM